MERRLIDANELFDFLTDQLDKETGFYSKGRNAGLNVARSALLDETITPTIAPPPNDPLTLEELREMDGEPVWVMQVNGELSPFWMLVDAEDESAASRLYSAMFEDYGTEWLAYRRKPEEWTM